MLKRQNDLIDIEESKEEARRQQEQIIRQAALEQAKMLQQKNERADLINGAEEQARILNNIPVEVDDMEQLAAQIVYNNTAEDYVLNGAKEQARILQNKNEEVEQLITSSEQAKIDETLNEIKRGAIEQARILQQNNERADLINGAEEQARILQANNEYIDIIDSAKEEARAIMNNNIKIDLINGAEEQAKMIFEKNKTQKSNLQSIFERNNSIMVDINDRYASITKPSKGLMLRNYQMDNINKRLQETKKQSNKKELLMNLKEQLNSNDFDFLKYNENTINSVKLAA